MILGNFIAVEHFTVSHVVVLNTTRPFASAAHSYQVGGNVQVLEGGAEPVREQLVWKHFNLVPKGHQVTQGQIVQLLRQSLELVYAQVQVGQVLQTQHISADR